MPLYKGRGAALIMVLVVAVVLTLLLTTAATLMENRMQLAERSKRVAEDTIALHSKLNELVYLVATQRITFAGVSQGTRQEAQLQNEDGLFMIPIVGDELRYDGHPYSFADEFYFSIQNTDGLLPVNSADQLWLERWLAQQQIGFLTRNTLLQSLADYADEDNWRRAAGAERQQYENNGLPPPTNFLLQQCSELYGVLNWPDLLEQFPALTGLCALRRAPQLNLNAVPEALWGVLWPNSLQRVLADRAQGRFMINDTDAIGYAPELMTVPEAYYTTLGGSRFRITVYSDTTSITREVQIGRDTQFPFRLRSVAASGIEKTPLD